MILSIANSTSYFSTVLLTQNYSQYQFVYDWNGDKRAGTIVWNRTTGTLTFGSSNAENAKTMSVNSGIIFF